MHRVLVENILIEFLVALPGRIKMIIKVLMLLWMNVVLRQIFNMLNVILRLRIKKNIPSHGYEKLTQIYVGTKINILIVNKK